MKQTETPSDTFRGVGYTRDRAGLPLEAVRVPVPQPAADEVLIRVAASSLNPLGSRPGRLEVMGLHGVEAVLSQRLIEGGIQNACSKDVRL